MLESKLKIWLESISLEGPVPTDCVAIYIGIFEQKSEYGLHFLGSSEFDAVDTEWACEKTGDYVPENRYLLGTGISSSTDWQAAQSQITSALRKVLLSGETVLSTTPNIAVGFDGGDLERI